MEELHTEIEAFIDETYLASLSERNLLKNLERFSEICGSAISETIKDTHSLEFLNSRLKSVRNAQLSQDTFDDLETFSIDEDDLSSMDSFRRRRITRIVENKQTIIKIIEEISPPTAKQIREDISPHSQGNHVGTPAETIPEIQTALPAPATAPPAKAKKDTRGRMDETFVNRSFSLIFGFMSFCLAVVIFALLISL